MSDMKKILIIVVLSLLLSVGCTRKDSSHIYSINDAYECGLISKDDLKLLAEYYNSVQNDQNMNSYSVEQLNENEIKRIKKTYLNEYIKKDYPFAKISDVLITNYYGKYGNCVALDIKASIIKIDVLVLEEYALDDIVFYNYTQPGLCLYIDE